MTSFRNDLEVMSRRGKRKVKKGGEIAIGSLSRAARAILYRIVNFRADQQLALARVSKTRVL